MKKYLIATLIVVALTLFMGKVIYEDHYKAVPVSKRPQNIIARFLDSEIWDIFE